MTPEQRQKQAVDEFVAAKLAEFPGLTQSQFDRLYGLLAPMRAELTALAKSRLRAQQASERSA